MKEIENYIKLSNNLFYGEDSLFKLVKEYNILNIMYYISSNLNNKNIVHFTLENLIIESNLKPNNHKGKTNTIFINILQKLQNNNFIDVLEYNKSLNFDTCNRKINTYKPKELIICRLNIDLSNKFTICTDKEYHNIMFYKENNINNTKLLYYYLYLKSRTYRKVNDTDTRPEVCFPTFELISKDIGLTDISIVKYNDILVKLEMIKIANPGLWYNASDELKNVRESVNFYYITDCGNKSDCADSELQEGISIYKHMDVNQNKIFTSSRKYKNNNRKLNGKLGSIIKKEKNGIATDKDIREKEKILQSTQTIDTRMENIRELLNQHPDQLLDEIYYDLGNGTKSNYYYQLQIELKLVSEETDELLVPKNYYNWIMINYTEQEKLKYIKIIQAYKNKHNKSFGSYRLGSEKDKDYIKYKADLEREKMKNIKIDNDEVKFTYPLEKKSLMQRIRKNDNVIVPDGSEDKKCLYDDYVLLSDYEYELLSKEMSDKQLQHYIDKLNNYIGSTGKQYKSHYYTIKLWYDNDLKNTPQSSKLKIYS